MTGPTARVEASAGPAGDVLALPATQLARDALELVRNNSSAVVLNHSVRSYLFGRLLAPHCGVELGRDVSDDLLFYSCVLHDMGLTEMGNRQQRFEVDGADVAAEFLTGKGLAAAEVDAVWDAIALHTSFGIATRRSGLTMMTHSGIGLDFGVGSEFLTDEQAAAIHGAYPRLEMAKSLADLIVGQVGARPEKGPAYSFPGTLAQQRATPPHHTDMEAMEAHGRWGS
jgi:hypothetical protein